MSGTLFAIAQVAASDPRYAGWVVGGSPDPNGPVQSAAEQLRRRTDAVYVVVTDSEAIRYSHPNKELIGKVVSTDPSAPLVGRDVVGLDRGALGWSARGKVPLRSPDGRVVGSVSVGIPLSAVSTLQRGLAMVMLVVATLAVAGALGISRATAQRYLADLVDDKVVSLSLRYGTHGRPEHSYEWSP